MAQLKEQIKEIVEEIIALQGFLLIRLDFNQRRNNSSIKVIIDKVGGGISLDECADLNRLLRTEIEKKGFIGEDFNVEVCSPGIDRNIKTENDFKSVYGRQVKIILKNPIAQTNELIGKVDAVEGDLLVLLSDRDEQIKITIDDIVKAKLKIRW